MASSWFLTFKEKMEVLFSDLWDFLGPFLSIFLSKMGAALAASALQAVKVVGETYADADGATKRDAAFQAILKDLEGKGIQIGVDVTSSMINAAIEVAVQKAKAPAAIPAAVVNPVPTPEAPAAQTGA